MNKRSKIGVPHIILGLIVLIAIAVRIFNPPAPLPPGPIGNMTNWNSSAAKGEMGPWEVDPTGTMWAGAWNEKTKDGKLKSAVWIIDFEKESAQVVPMKDGVSVESLSISSPWNDTQLDDLKKSSKGLDLNPPVEMQAKGSLDLIVSQPDSANVMKPLQFLASSISQGSRKADLDFKSKAIGTDVQSIFQLGCGTYISKMGAKDGASSVGLIEGLTKQTGKLVVMAVPQEWTFGRFADVDDLPIIRSEQPYLYAFSLEGDNNSGIETYYIADAKTGTAKKAFDLQQLPGRVEGLWVSPAGILVVCMDREKTYEMVYDAKTGKLNEIGKNGYKIDVKKNWPLAPEQMMFVFYAGGYNLDLATGATKQLFSYKNLTEDENVWRGEVQQGRLYPRKDGKYVSVSFAGDAIDIRVLGKDGKLVKDLLPRS